MYVQDPPGHMTELIPVSAKMLHERPQTAHLQQACEFGVPERHVRLVHRPCTDAHAQRRQRQVDGLRLVRALPNALALLQPLAAGQVHQVQLAHLHLRLKEQSGCCMIGAHVWRHVELAHNHLRCKGKLRPVTHESIQSIRLLSAKAPPQVSFDDLDASL